MNFPFGKNSRKTPPLIDPKGQRLLGFTLEGNEPIWAPRGHSLLLAPSGAGKTTSGAMPWLYSFAASEPEKAVLVIDPKDGEMAIQSAAMLARMGRKVAVIDDMGVWHGLDAYRISLNPFGAAAATFRRDPRDMIYSTDNITQAAIKEPPDDSRNKYFRDWPRSLIEFAILVYAKRKLDLVTPGGISTLLSDQEMLLRFAAIEAEEGDAYLKGLAQSILAMATQKHEHWPQHLQEAQRALRIFAPGTSLFEAGRDATHTHAQLIREGYIIFLVGPQAVMNSLGPYYALHIMAFAEALYQRAGSLRIIADEFTNAPLSRLVENLTTLRSYGGEVHMIAQSRSEIVRKFGKLESETIAENAVTQIWYGFGSLAEAQMVSEMMGEEHAVQTALGAGSDSARLQTNLSLTKQRRMTPAEHLAVPRDQQLIYIQGLGFILARKVGMQNIAPFCFEVAENPMEGGILPPDPWIAFPSPAGGSS